ncbi:MAG: 2-C-methyl-D-erythritol 4-phosphate cytidylyltransferase [Thermodesulfobacteriota bacterium]
MKTAAIIPSAGIGKRMGFKKKPFISLAGRPILAHTVAVFEGSPHIDALVLVVPKGDEDICQEEIVGRFRYKKVIKIVSGGKERQDSVRAALDSLSVSWDIVVVHDGVRPFVTPALIEGVIKEAKKTGCAISAVPVKDTIKEVQDGTVRRTIPREPLWAVQTPQAFKAEILINAHKKAFEDGFYSTDDSAIVEWLGYKVSVVEGLYENIKITTPEDIMVGEALLKGKEVGMNIKDASRLWV